MLFKHHFTKSLDIITRVQSQYTPVRNKNHISIPSMKDSL